jgi:hypothetical protein
MAEAAGVDVFAARPKRKPRKAARLPINRPDDESQFPIRNEGVWRKADARRTSCGCDRRPPVSSPKSIRLLTCMTPYKATSSRPVLCRSVMGARMACHPHCLGAAGVRRPAGSPSPRQLKRATPIKRESKKFDRASSHTVAAMLSTASANLASRVIVAGATLHSSAGRSCLGG